MTALTSIREACARLRRLPESHWGQPPREPLGARAPHIVPSDTGATVETLVRAWIVRLQSADAEVRGIAAYSIAVHRLALPDVLEALAKSAAKQPAIAAEVAAVAAEISSARL